jgi:hypothetical protein
MWLRLPYRGVSSVLVLCPFSKYLQFSVAPLNNLVVRDAVILANDEPHFKYFYKHYHDQIGPKHVSVSSWKHNLLLYNKIVVLDCICLLHFVSYPVGLSGLAETEAVNNND